MPVVRKLTLPYSTYVHLSPLFTEQKVITFMLMAAFRSHFSVALLLLSLLLSVIRPALSAEKDFAEIHHLWDSPRLCNNGISQNVTRLCSTEAYRESVVCDERVISSGQCREVAIEMDNFTVGHLLSIIPTIDSDLSFRRIIIKISDPSLNYKEVGKEIDNFLMHRLWWYVSKEPYEWSDESHSKHLYGHVKHMIVLDRVQHGFEKSLRILGAQQYPAAAVCNESPILVGRADVVHPGWLPVLSFYTSALGEVQSGVFGVYVSYKNDPNDSPAFITGADCPHLMNKWECAFLPATNCSIPDIITKCTGNDCVRHVVPDNMAYVAVFDRANTSGQYVPSNTKEFDSLRSYSRATKKDHELDSFLMKAHLYPTPKMKYVVPYNTKQAPWHGMMAVNVYPFMKLLFRQTAFYRSEIAKMIHRFRAVNNFPKTERCVAAQVRRGDRTLANVKDIMDYCYQNRKDVGRVSDLGCYSTPFAAVTLKHVVDSAATLVPPEVRTLIVATDDEPWLIEQIEELRKVYPDWKIIFLESPKVKVAKTPADDKEEAYYYMRARGGTASGTFWWGSIEVGRQCEGFVGHFGSGATMFYHYQMCEQHMHHENVCPATFDVRSIPELQTHLNP